MIESFAEPQPKHLCELEPVITLQLLLPPYTERQKGIYLKISKLAAMFSRRGDYTKRLKSFSVCNPLGKK